MAGELGGSDAGQAVVSGLADLLTAAGVFVFGGERWRDGLDGGCSGTPGSGGAAGVPDRIHACSSLFWLGALIAAADPRFLAHAIACAERDSADYFTVAGTTGSLDDYLMAAHPAPDGSAVSQ
jgi:hypothetical protein